MFLMTKRLQSSCNFPEKNNLFIDCSKTITRLKFDNKLIFNGLFFIEFWRKLPYGQFTPKTTPSVANLLKATEGG
jgi:hypothetical protein